MARLMEFYSGHPETRCGIGSTLENTEKVRRELPVLLREFGVHKLVEAPCGDFHWLSTLDLSGVSYVGIDDDPVNLMLATRQVSNASQREFSHQDIPTAKIPNADLMLCRELLQHLPTKECLGALTAFLDSYTPFLLITSHRNELNGDITTGGHFREVNLRREPFNLPMPIRQIEDRDSYLGLWTREQIENSLRS